MQFFDTGLKSFPFSLHDFGLFLVGLVADLLDGACPSTFLLLASVSAMQFPDTGLYNFPIFLQDEGEFLLTGDLFAEGFAGEDFLGDFLGAARAFGSRPSLFLLGAVSAIQLPVAGLNNLPATQ